MKILIAFLTFVTCFAQWSAPLAACPDGTKTGEKKEGERGRESLTRVERDRLRALFRKAHKQDGVCAAREKAKASFENYRTALREAIAAMDPEAVGILDKLERRRGRHDPFRSLLDLGPRMRSPYHFERLTEEERKTWMMAWEKIKGEPFMQSRRKDLDEANSSEERQKVHRAYRERIETAMIKAQPSLAPVLKKLKAPRKKPDEARQRRKSDPKRG